MEDFLKLPLKFSDIFQNGNFKKCGLGESVSHNLQLIIFSHHGEHRYNKSFGCDIWEMDFDLIMSLRLWEEKLRHSLEQAISENEKRIQRPDITVKVSEVEKWFNSNKNASIKRKVNILIKAKITKTGEDYFFSTELYLSPVSYN